MPGKHPPGTKTGYAVLALLLCAGIGFAAFGSGSSSASSGVNSLDRIVVIYLENRSVDNLFHGFPGAGTAATASFAPQVDANGKPYATLPAIPDSRFPANLPNAPFNIDKYVPQTGLMPSPIHSFYQHQWQINGGRNDKFVLYAAAGAGGTPMGYHDYSGSKLWKYARDYTFCDAFFQAAFGGSFLNHQWLVAAATPLYPNAPSNMVVKNETDPATFVDGVVTPDGYAVNSMHPVWPTTKRPGSREILPPLTNPNIGDRLTAKGVSWKWYSGGWNVAVADPAKAAKNSIIFQFHHQPFAFFKSCMRGTGCFDNNLKDRSDLLADIRKNALPSVTFYKPNGSINQHPGYANVKDADDEVAMIVEAIKKSKMWDHAAIIVTYDEFGGMWDHVAPPVIDRWGPGSRIPAIVISPFAKKGFVDHTVYDTTSILSLIETRFGVKPLSSRDAKAANMLNAFSF